MFLYLSKLVEPDELCELAAIQASFVIFRENEESVNISARSQGLVNVQFIVEKLGGGGSSTMAGAQIPNGEMKDVVTRLIGAIDEYLDN